MYVCRVHSAAALSDTDRRASVSSDELSRRISCCSDSDLLDKNAYETIRSGAHLPNMSNGRLTLVLSFVKRDIFRLFFFYNSYELDLLFLP